MTSYIQRNEALLLLGYRDYKHYLRSSLWKRIRNMQITSSDECYGCFRKAPVVILQVHHGEYTLENLSGQSLNGLFTVCSRCHKWIEITKTGYKRSPEDATKELIRLHKIYSSRGANIVVTNPSLRENTRLSNRI